MLNVSLLEDRAGWFLFLQGGNEGGFQKGELFVEETNVDREKVFAMIPDFTHLGQIEVKASLHEKTIMITISAEDEERAGHMGRHFSLLEEGLRSAGLNPGAMTCNVKPRDEQELPLAAATESSPFVDMVI
jgi:hypothetical protein